MYAKLDKYYTLKSSVDFAHQFAMYAKLDKYYTYFMLSLLAKKQFAMYAKLDKYYTSNAFRLLLELFAMYAT